MYIINTRFPVRPTFVDDAEIVEALTDYEQKTKELEALNKELAILKKA